MFGGSDNHEQRLAEIFASALGLVSVDPAADFFELGGDSLTAFGVASAVSSEFGTPVPDAAVFEAPTVRALAQRLRAGWSGTRKLDLVATPALDSYPITANQEYWLSRTAAHDPVPTSGSRPLPLTLRLCGELDVDRLGTALQRLAAHHAALRVAIGHGSDNGFVQTVAADVDVPLAQPLLDATGTIPNASPATPGALDPFDITRAPMLRAQLYQTAARVHTLEVIVDHLVFDGYSEGVLLNSLARLYDDPATSLPPDRYLDWLVAHDGFRHDRRADVVEYWRTKLETLTPYPDLGLPAPTRPQPPLALGTANVAQNSTGPRPIDDDGIDPAPGSASRFERALAALASTLGPRLGMEELLIYAPVSNRGQPELRNTVGWLSGVVPFRVSASVDTGSRAAIRAEVASVYELSHVPFNDVVYEFAPQFRGTRPGRLFLNVHDSIGDAIAAKTGLRFEPVEPYHPKSAFPGLSISLTEQGTREVVEVIADGSVVDADFVQDVAESFAAALGHARREAVT